MIPKRMYNDKRDALKRLARWGSAAASLALLAACSPSTPSAPKFQGIDVTGAEYAKDFPLADQNGKPRNIKDFAGKVVVVFFGYTQCPDVCPTTMSELAEVKRSLGADGDKLQGVFITVDPERDTPEVLKAYMANFDPTFVGLIPSLEQLPALTKDFKIYYKKVDGKTATSYTMDHSAGSFIYDPKGNLRVYSRYGSGAQALFSDVKALISG
ncbi:SCO family protein [Diaphorobacter sp. HDW4A]|uniref:SCO family protein n=1 Tax=Diaphorobacter sp. HDW4A TaxID=2714924 RepID=UPI001F0EFA31|nr:SCO family protein [Diaphorobacter sp. HDW4A]